MDTIYIYTTKLSVVVETGERASAVEQSWWYILDSEEVKTDYGEVYSAKFHFNNKL